MASKFKPNKKGVITGTKKNDKITWASSWKKKLTVNAGNGNDIINFAKSKYNNKLNGGKGNDVIYGGKGNDIINGGAGNDKITLNSAKGTIKMTAGSGNDTLILKKASQDVNLVFDKDTTFSYEKKGNNLVINGSHSKKSETLTLTNFFTSKSTSVYDDNYEGFRTIYPGYIADAYLKTNLVKGSDKSDIKSMVENGTVTIRGNAAQNNILFATYAKNNTLYGGNKTDIMYNPNSPVTGLTTFVTGKKGTTYIDDTKNGTDKYIVQSLKDTKTIIKNGDNKYSDNDTLQINGADLNDLVLFNVSYVNENHTYHGNETHLYLSTGEQLLNNIKNNVYANPYNLTLNDTSKDAKGDNIKSVSAGVDGVMLDNYFYFSTIGYKRVENIDIADANGKNVKHIDGDMIETAYSNMKNKVAWYLSNQTSYDNTRDLLNYIKTTLSDKSATADAKADAEKKASELAEIAKSIKLGTDGNDTYTNVKNNSLYKEYNPFNTDSEIKGAAIYSGKGNDTFEMDAMFGVVNIYADSNSKGLLPLETDKIIISADSFDANGIDISFNSYKHDVVINTKGVQNALTYDGFFREDGVPINAKNLIIQDANRSYDVSYIANSISKCSFADTTNNNLVYLAGDTEFTSGKGYNRVYSNNSDAHEIIFTGGHDTYISKGSSDDIYRDYSYKYNNDSTNSSLNINDAKGNDKYNIGYTSVKITDSKGNDEYNLSGSNVTAIINDTNGDDIYNIDLKSGTSVVINEATSSSQNDTLNIDPWSFSDTRLYFDVQMADTATGLTTNSLFIFNKKDDLTLDNIKSANPEGIKITDQYKGQRINTIVFEHYTSANINNWVSKIQSDVVGWLNNNTGYTSTADVLNSGNEADINALLAVYNKGYYQYTY